MPSAHNPIFTWRDQAQSRSSIQYSEGAAANSFFRKGVGAFIHGANGKNWQTTVWLGSTSTSGTNAANLLDGTLGTKRTWAKYVFNLDPHNTDTLPFSAWIAGVQPSALRAGAAAPDEASTPDAPSLSTAADDDTSGPAVIPNFGEVDGLVVNAVDSTFESLGSFEGYDTWRVDDSDGAVHLFASNGETLAQTMSTAEDFAAIGVPMRIDTPAGAVQFALLPSGDLDTSGLTSAGFDEVSSALYATATPPDAFSEIEVPSPTARGGSPVTVPLFTAPQR